MQIAVEKFSEATVGYRKDKEVAERWAQLFSTPYFLVTPVSLTWTLSFFLLFFIIIILFYSFPIFLLIVFI